MGRKKIDTITITDDLIENERARQEMLWGVQNHDPITYMSILIEEIGEFAKEANDLRFPKGTHSITDDIAIEERGKQRLIAEAIQVAAVAKSLVECLLRDKWNWTGGKR